MAAERKVPHGGDSDADLAVTIAGTEGETPLGIFVGEKSGWEQSLSTITGLRIRLRLYDAETCPEIISYCREASFLLYDGQPLDDDEITAITDVPDGVRIDFRSGNSRTLLGVTIERAEREVGRVGDRLPRRQFDRVPGPTPEPPEAVADLKKWPE